MPRWILDDETQEALRKLMNSAVGRAAASLSEVVGQRIVLSVPNIRVYCSNDSDAGLPGELTHPETAITQTFEGAVCGQAALCFPEDSSLALARLLSGDVGHSVDGLDAELSGILLEVGNLVLDGVMGSLSNCLLTNLQYSLPEIQSANRLSDRDLLDTLRQDDVLIGDLRFGVSQQQIAGSIVIVFAAGTMGRILDEVFSPELA